MTDSSIQNKLVKKTTDKFGKRRLQATMTTESQPLGRLWSHVVEEARMMISVNGGIHIITRP